MEYDMIRFDLRNSITPLVLLEVGSVMQRMSPGECIEIRCEDRSVINDLRRIHYDFVCMGLDNKIMKDGSGYLIVMEKNPQTRSCVMSDLDLSSVQVASIADARGSACPGPLLEAKKGIGKVKVGEVLEIYSNDSGTRTDIPAWAGKVGHEYLGMVTAEGYDKHFVRRKK